MYNYAEGHPVFDNGGQEMTVNMSSVLDNDAYKFSMGNMVLRLFPRLNVRYELINRGGTQFPPGFADGLKFDLKRLSRLSLRAEEKKS